jgi:pantothenate kinase
VSVDVIPPVPWFLNKPFELTVGDHAVTTVITTQAWTDYWRPLLGYLRDAWSKAQPGRVLVAVAGVPGVGKSVFAEQLNWLVYKQMVHHDAHGMALPMDGFHFPNSYLQSHARKLPDGTTIPLMEVKGQPDTIDVGNLRKHLEDLRARKDVVEWPGYSRFAHDVVPNKYRIPVVTNMVFVEGNYLLVDRGPFAGLPKLFDVKIYVDGPAPIIMMKLMERHIKGGKTVEAAKDWVKRIDLPNARIAESTRKTADVVVERDSENELSGIHWKGEEE